MPHCETRSFIDPKTKETKWGSFPKKGDKLAEAIMKHKFPETGFEEFKPIEMEVAINRFRNPNSK